jgi:hypothetical protein
MRTASTFGRAGWDWLAAFFVSTRTTAHASMNGRPLTDQEARDLGLAMAAAEAALDRLAARMEIRRRG